MKTNIVYSLCAVGQSGQPARLINLEVGGSNPPRATKVKLVVETILMNLAPRLGKRGFYFKPLQRIWRQSGATPPNSKEGAPIKKNIKNKL